VPARDGSPPAPPLLDDELAPALAFPAESAFWLQAEHKQANTTGKAKERSCMGSSINGRWHSCLSPAPKDG
jgi:hypothetical protein